MNPALSALFYLLAFIFGAVAGCALTYRVLFGPKWWVDFWQAIGKD